MDNKMKITAAAAIAVITMLSFAACADKTTADDSSAENSASAGVSSTAEDISAQSEQEHPEESETSEEASGEDESVAESTPVDTSPIVYKDGSTLAFDEDFNEQDMLSQEEIDEISKLVLKQYDAIRIDDAAAYLETVNVSGFFSAEHMDKALANIYDEDHDEYTLLQQFTNQYFEFLIEACDPIEDGELEEEYNNDEVEAFKNNTALQVSKLNADVFRKRLNDSEDNFVYQYIRENIEELNAEGGDGRLSEDAAYLMMIEEFERDGDNLYVQIEMAVADGDFEYDLDDIIYWKTADTSGVYMGECYHGPNEYPGMSAQEIVDELVSINGGNMSEAEQTARAFFSAATDYLEAEEKDIGAAIHDGDFAKANSPEGLDLSDTAEASGDKALLELLEYYEYQGNVFVGECGGAISSNRMFVQYKNPSGVIGQVPPPDSDDTEIIWGTYTE